MYVKQYQMVSLLAVIMFVIVSINFYIKAYDIVRNVSLQTETGVDTCIQKPSKVTFFFKNTYTWQLLI